MIMISLILRIVEVLLCLKKKPFKTRARNVNLNSEEYIRHKFKQPYA